MQGPGSGTTILSCNIRTHGTFISHVGIAVSSLHGLLKGSAV